MRKRPSRGFKTATDQILELSKIFKQPLKIIYESITNSPEIDKIKNKPKLNTEIIKKKKMKIIKSGGKKNVLDGFNSRNYKGQNL